MTLSVTVTLVDCDLSAASDAALVVGKGFSTSGPGGSLENLVLRGCRFHHSIAGVRVNTREDSGFPYGTKGGVSMNQGHAVRLHHQQEYLWSDCS